ncbi:MAG: iron-containing alcohol dehydrogenase, partial [Thermoplasmata archaeon]|nr:iron-containing alcohol dehydrogenase [Thermoplasmata archaeon]
MVAEAPAGRTPVVGRDSPFGKARSMVFPRTVLAGHGVLNDLGTICRQFDFGDRGAVITGHRTASLAGHRAAEILQASGFTIATILAKEATPAEVDRVAAEVSGTGAQFVVGVGGG